MHFLRWPHAALRLLVRVHKVRKRMRLLVTWDLWETGTQCGYKPPHDRSNNQPREPSYSWKRYVVVSICGFASSLGKKGALGLTE